MLVSGLPRPDTSSSLLERKQSPRKTRGFCVVRLFDEQRVLTG